VDRAGAELERRSRTISVMNTPTVGASWSRDRRCGSVGPVDDRSTRRGVAGDENYSRSALSWKPNPGRRPGSGAGRSATEPTSDPVGLWRRRWFRRCRPATTAGRDGSLSPASAGDAAGDQRSTRAQRHGSLATDTRPSAGAAVAQPAGEAARPRSPGGQQGAATAAGVGGVGPSSSSRAAASPADLGQRPGRVARSEPARVGTGAARPDRLGPSMAATAIGRSAGRSMARTRRSAARPPPGARPSRARPGRGLGQEGSLTGRSSRAAVGGEQPPQPGRRLATRSSHGSIHDTAATPGGGSPPRATRARNPRASPAAWNLGGDAGGGAVGVTAISASSDQERDQARPALAGCACVAKAQEARPTRPWRAQAGGPVPGPAASRPRPRWPGGSASVELGDGGGDRHRRMVRKKVSSRCRR
jgi:hypothetical protein